MKISSILGKKVISIPPRTNLPEVKQFYSGKYMLQVDIYDNRQVRTLVNLLKNKVISKETIWNHLEGLNKHGV